jgi:hypothetical protein
MAREILRKFTSVSARGRSKKEEGRRVGYSSKLPPLVIGFAFAEPLFLQISVMHSEHDSVAAQGPTLSAPTSIHRRAVAPGGFLFH